MKIIKANYNCIITNYRGPRRPGWMLFKITQNQWNGQNLETEITLEIHCMGLIMADGKVLGMKAKLNISRIPKRMVKLLFVCKQRLFCRSTLA